MIKTQNQSNYLAKMVRLKEPIPHKGADKLICWNIDFNNVITDLSYKKDDICVYFQVGSCINKDFLSFLNAFQESQLNKDTTKKGYFNNKGVVKATNLRNEKSQGFLIKFEVLEEFLKVKVKPEIDIEFDTINNILLCEKYEPVVQLASSEPKKKGEKKVKLKDIMVKGQFRFHDETGHLKKNLHNLNLTDEIVITSKLHGSSCILSNVLVKRKLSWFERVLLYFKVKIVETEFAYIYSSGKPKGQTVKGIELRWINKGKDFYSTNIWKQANDDFKDCIEPGISLYGELVGGHVQKKFDYTKLHNKKDYGFLIYRITRTNSEGFVDEFSWNQIETYCEKYNLKTVPVLFYGTLKQWFAGKMYNSEETLDILEKQYLEKECPYSINKVPDEGICVRIEKPFQVYKLKSHKFLMVETAEETVNES